MGMAKGDYTWGEGLGCEEVRDGGIEEGKKEGGKGGDGKVEKKDELKDEVKEEDKEKKKGLKKADVDQWRNSVMQENDPVSGGSEQELTEKKKNKHSDKKGYERKEWRRREKRK